MEKAVVWILFLVTICQMVDLSASNLCLKPNPCNGRGICNFYDCDCEYGYKGRYCQTEYDPCVEHPDHHHCNDRGTCFKTGVGKSECKCNRGFGGYKCGDTVDHCFVSKFECKNGATCHYDIANDFYSCNCVRGYKGKHCQHEDKEELKKMQLEEAAKEQKKKKVEEGCFLRENKCHNGGTCFLNENTNFYDCHCIRGYKGTRCHKEDKEELIKMQLEKAAIEEKKKKEEQEKLKHMQLEKAAKEEKKKKEATHCSTSGGRPRCYKGKCTPEGRCKCNPGWSGDLCGEGANDCSPMGDQGPRCHNGWCTLQGRCKCNPGWSGKLCTKVTNVCLTATKCLNGGTCVSQGRFSYYCDCPRPYTGRKCEMKEQGKLKKMQLEKAAKEQKMKKEVRNTRCGLDVGSDHSGCGLEVDK